MLKGQRRERGVGQALHVGYDRDDGDSGSRNDRKNRNHRKGAQHNPRGFFPRGRTVYAKTSIRRAGRLEVGFPERAQATARSGIGTGQDREHLRLRCANEGDFIFQIRTVPTMALLDALRLVWRFCPGSNTLRNSKSAAKVAMGLFASRVKRTTTRLRSTKGDCFAEAHVSTAATTPRQDPRVPRPHEDQRRPQSAGSAPQEGTPSAHPRLAQEARECPATRAKSG